MSAKDIYAQYVRHFNHLNLNIMFGKSKLKARIAELEKSYKSEVAKNIKIADDLANARKEQSLLRTQTASLEKKYEEAKTDGHELIKAVEFIRLKGYKIGEYEDGGRSYYGESTVERARNTTIKELNSKLIASEKFENDLKNRLSELFSEKTQLSKENDNLKDELARRPFAPAKKKTSKK